MRMLRGNCNLLRSSGSSVVLLQASLAGAEDLERVSSGEKAELLSDPALDFFQFRGKELDGITARCTNHVMVCSAIQAVLVTHHAVAKVDFIGEAALSEEFEGPVHSGVADARIESFDKTVKLFCTEVVTCLQEDVENAIAFCALLKASFPEVIREDSLRFA